MLRRQVVWRYWHWSVLPVVMLGSTCVPGAGLVVDVRPVTLRSSGNCIWMQMNLVSWKQELGHRARCDHDHVGILWSEVESGVTRRFVAPTYWIRSTLFIQGHQCIYVEPSSWSWPVFDEVLEQDEATVLPWAAILIVIWHLSWWCNWVEHGWTDPSSQLFILLTCSLFRVGVTALGANGFRVRLTVVIGTTVLS